MKAIYFSDTNIEAQITPLGMIVTDLPELYRKGVPGKRVIEVDLLDYLIQGLRRKVVWPDNLKTDIARNFVIPILDGRQGDEKYREDFQALVGASEFFRYYLAYCAEFGDRNLSLIQRVINPLREALDFQREVISNKIITLHKAKFCMLSHERLYYACGVLNQDEIPVEHYTLY